MNKQVVEFFANHTHDVVFEALGNLFTDFEQATGFVGATNGTVTTHTRAQAEQFAAAAAEEKPAVAGEEKPTTAAEETPAAVSEEKPTTAAEETPAAVSEETSAPVNEEKTADEKLADAQQNGAASKKDGNGKR